MSHIINIKRVYEDPAPSDGLRVLVDRLWPRGLAKARAHIDVWLKDIAPSAGLRTWFSHDPQKWPDFQKRYRQELKHNKAGLDTIRSSLKEHKTLTLLYAAKDTAHNHALVLRDYLKSSK